MTEILVVSEELLLPPVEVWLLELCTEMLVLRVLLAVVTVLWHSTLMFLPAVPVMCTVLGHGVLTGAGVVAATGLGVGTCLGVGAVMRVI